VESVTAPEPTGARVRLRAEIAALPPYRQGRPAPADGFKLSSNENPFDPLPSVQAAIAAAATEVNRYPDATALRLRERLAERFGVSPDEVIVGAGSVSLLAQFILAAAGPGDEVVYAWRSFEAYPGLVTVSGATSVQVPNRADHGHDLDAMADAITDRTRAVIVCSPNNPTGVAVTADEFERFMARVPSDVLVLLDEAYAEFVRDEASVDGSTLIGRYPNLVVLRTFSKAYGLAGLRVGYAITTAPIAEGLRRTALPFGVSALAQKAAVASLDAGEEMEARVSAVKQERVRMAAELAAQGWKLQPSQGNFLWIRADADLLARLVEAFNSAGILVRGYQGDGVRITVADPASNNRVLRLLAAHAA
jgi:histidinol-phosphate aminotransferase